MHDDKDGSEAGGGVIAGIGFVSGVRCLVSASNSAIKGGTMSPMGVQKTLRLQKIALEQKLQLGYHLDQVLMLEIALGSATIFYIAVIKQALVHALFRKHLVLLQH